MSYIYHPFRPNLQGIFLKRFQQKVQKLCRQADPYTEVEKKAIEEFQWATDEIQINPKQRRIYRAAWLLLRDLLRAGWVCRWHNGNLEIASPMLPDQYHNADEIQRVKATIRNTMMEARRQKIADSRDFIERVENPSPAMRARVPITALIAEGPALTRDMEAVAALGDQGERLARLRTAIQPYLQLVRENEICSHTGHRLSDIWRYFRFTWSTPAETTPGRTLLYLIRDAARPYHPIMGLASLENAPIKIKDRDGYIGWTFDGFKCEVEMAADDEAVRESFGRLLEYIQVALKDISIEGLCTEKECENPTPRLLQKLTAIAVRSVQEREVALREWGERDEDSDESAIERSELGNISRAAVDALYRRKRAEQLGRLLSARRVIQNILSEPNFGSSWRDFLSRESGQTAIRASLLAQKSRHIGTSVLELNVCGAIPPYNELLAGKLVALVALSPQVISDYRQRYGNRPSDIASRLKGENVIRPAELVFLGTTSLYRAGSSQYNRLKLPAGLLCSGSPAVRWEHLGETTGYGTLHISRLTLQCLEEVENEGGVSLINNIFGEGPSPKLRLIRQGITDIFEPGQRDVLDELTKHSMGRLVYGAWLAINGRAYLNGSVDHPTYYFDQSLDPVEGTERIVDYWRERWLLPRLNYREALDRMAVFRPESLYASKDVPKKEEIRYKLISAEVSIMTEWAANDQGSLRNFLRNLYRGSSAYADYMDSGWLNSIHVDTGLDKVIVDAVSSGKSIVLTGNPGDGKTHLLRVLKPRLDGLPTNPMTELDASRLHDAQLQSMWSDALAQGRPFCVAINEAVLFNLAKKYPGFVPLQEARYQVENAVLYENENVREFGVVVFDLSRRDVLSQKIVNPALDKLIELSSQARCDLCPVEGCDFVRHRELLCTQRFRDRLQLLLNRVSCRGTHATLRELQAFISYMLFAGRPCSELIASSHEDQFALSQLPFKGNGKLFDEIRNTFDPIKVAHPLWDEALINGETSPADWLPEATFEEGGLDPSNWDRFVAQKRTFYFFHEKGTDLLQLSGDDESVFIGLLQQKSDRDTLRRLIFLINHFFGNIGESDELHVWQSHRYNQSPRRVLYSAQVLKRSLFEIKRPFLISSMAQGFDLAQDHIMLRLRSHAPVRLRVDFSLYELLAKAERGVPVMSLEGDASRRLWQFMENLSNPSASSNDAEIRVILLDSTTSERLSLIVDIDERKYLTVTRKGE